LIEEPRVQQVGLNQTLDAAGVFQCRDFLFGEAYAEVVFEKKHKFDMLQRIPPGLAGPGRVLVLGNFTPQNKS
jgi:hypothetical protein